MRKIFLFAVLVNFLIGCDSNAQENNLDSKQLIERFNFEYLKTSDLPEELQKELFIPFLDNGKYYISDYEGNRVSKQEFEEIVLFDFAPFFMGKIGEEYFLYSFPEQKILPQSFSKKLDINNFKSGDAKGYYNKLVLANEEILLPKPYIDTTSMDYTKRKEYEIGKLIEQGVLKENSRMGNHIYVYKFNSDEIILKLNDNLEVILENKPLFMNLDNFDLETIPIELRPNKEELRRPTSIQEYYVLNDGNYGHVFTCKGKYLSSHKGWYNEFFSLNGLHRKLKFRRLYVPVGEFQEDGVAYYVRLTDGFEYRK